MPFDELTMIIFTDRNKLSAKINQTTKTVPKYHINYFLTVQLPQSTSQTPRNTWKYINGKKTPNPCVQWCIHADRLHTLSWLHSRSTCIFLLTVDSQSATEHEVLLLNRYPHPSHFALGDLPHLYIRSSTGYYVPAVISRHLETAIDILEGF